MEQLDFIYAAGTTRRFHTLPILQQQNIADHSWHVTMLLWVMYGQQEPGISIALLMAGMTHDMAECQVGDIPAPAKRGMSHLFPDFREKWGQMEQDILTQFQMDWEGQLTEEEQRRLKLADAMEGALHCVRERWLGNRAITICYSNFISYVDALKPVGLEDEVRSYIIRMWEAANG